MRSRGFTLIELMVVMVVILFLSGGSIAAFLNFNRTQVINNDSRNLSVELSRVRTMASSLQYPVGCSALGGVNITSAQVDGKLNGVKVTTLCNPSNIESPVTRVLTGSIFQNDFDITFVPGTGYTQNGSEYQIVVVLEADSSVTKTVSVDALGVVNIL